jgi:hypothetical protein
MKWSDKKADGFQKALLDIFKRRQVYPVGTSVDVQVFRSYSLGEQCILAGYLTKRSRRETRKPAPYHVAFRFMVSDALTQVHPETELHLVISEQSQYRQRALENYERVKRLDTTGLARQLKGIIFQEPIDFAGLQAADLLAHHWYNYLVRGRMRLNQENVRAMNALTQRRRVMPHCDAAGIERIFKELDISPQARATLRAYEEPK